MQGRTTELLVENPDLEHPTYPIYNQAPGLNQGMELSAVIHYAFTHSVEWFWRADLFGGAQNNPLILGLKVVIYPAHIQAPGLNSKMGLLTVIKHACAHGA